MATTKTAAKKPGTAVVKWEEELAKQAAIAAGMEDSTATGQFFGLKSGQLTFNDAPMPNNEMAVVILDGVLENVYYAAEYDQENPAAPTCFAFGRDEKVMSPHSDVVEAGQTVHDTCAGCPMNEFGSAERGRGKACRNTRRLAMIPAGSFDDRGRFTPIADPEHFEKTAIAFMKLPVTSVKGYAGFVKQIAGALKRPPHGIFARVKVVPDSNTQFKVLFEALTQIPDKLMPIIMARHNEASELIEFPYSLEQPEAQPASGRGGKGKAPARGGNSKAAPARKIASTNRGRY